MVSLSPGVMDSEAGNLISTMSPLAPGNKHDASVSSVLQIEATTFPAEWIWLLMPQCGYCALCLGPSRILPPGDFSAHGHMPLQLHASGGRGYMLSPWFWASLCLALVNRMWQTGCCSSSKPRLKRSCIIPPSFLGPYNFPVNKAWQGCCKIKDHVEKSPAAKDKAIQEHPTASQPSTVHRIMSRIMTKHFPRQMKKSTHRSKEAQQPASRMNTEKITLRHILVKLMETGHKEKTLKESRQEKKKVSEHKKKDCTLHA